MALIFSAVSCEKFFDRAPEDSFASSAFFTAAIMFTFSF